MKTELLLIGTLLVFLVATGATWVMAQSGETILVCAAKDGTLRIIADRDECKRKETIYEWYAYTVVDALLGDEAAARLAADDALQWQIDTMVKADSPCFDTTNRYVDCGNGTVHDTVTNLIWLKNAKCYGDLNYAAANNAAAGLEHGECGLADGSSPGDWRLPTK